MQTQPEHTEGNLNISSNMSAGDKQATKGVTQQFLTYVVGNEEYGVDIMKVREVKGWTDVTRLPNTPEYMRGVLNLRGIVIPIFDLRARFGGALTKATEKHVMIILAVSGRTVGLLVDTVSDIISVDSDEIKEAPESEEDAGRHFISGLIAVDNRMVVLLDIEKLIDCSVMASAIATDENKQ